MLFLILTPENKEVFAHLLKYLDKKGWTFGSGKPIEDYRDAVLLDFHPYIFLYEDKTIRIGKSLDYISKTVPIITVKDDRMFDVALEYEKWLKDFKAGIEEAIKKGVYIHDTKISL